MNVADDAPPQTMKALRSLLLAAAAAASAEALSLSLLQARSAHLARLSAAPPTALPPDEWHTQRVDHFNVLSNNRTWLQRFWTNASFFTGDGPVFVYVEGEGAGSPGSVLGGQHVELAASRGALILSLEHRFYGASSPTGDMSEESLALLSSHQAIGDLANFISTFVRVKYPTAGPVITFGGSYPGALSAWARLRLPHAVWGAFSTSSPVLAQVDFVGG